LCYDAFLVIFHFIDDDSKPNLRTGNTKNFPISEAKAWITWAPSHPEEARLAELLRYANIVDGLSEGELRRLRSALEAKTSDGEWKLMSALKERSFFFYDDPTSRERILCAELCPEYIDYLRKILDPHLKT